MLQYPLTTNHCGSRMAALSSISITATAHACAVKRQIRTAAAHPRAHASPNFTGCYRPSPRRRERAARRRCPNKPSAPHLPARLGPSRTSQHRPSAAPALEPFRTARARRRRFTGRACAERLGAPLEAEAPLRVIPPRECVLAAERQLESVDGLGCRLEVRSGSRRRARMASPESARTGTGFKLPPSRSSDSDAGLPLRAPSPRPARWRAPIPGSTGGIRPSESRTDPAGLGCHPSPVPTRPDPDDRNLGSAPSPPAATGPPLRAGRGVAKLEGGSPLDPSPNVPLDPSRDPSRFDYRDQS
jgi:hypothetical protein